MLPPAVTEPAEGPQIYIWGGDGDENRATLPRASTMGAAPATSGSGWKSVAHTIALYIQWISDNEVSNQQYFPLLIDAVRQKVRTLNLKVNITDPETGEVSTLTDIGERILWTYSTPIATADQRGILNSCMIRLPFHERFMG